LLRQTASGDRKAFTDLCLAISRELFGIALRITRRRDWAEDVLQESLFSVWRRAAQYNPTKGSAMAWLAAIVRHAAIDHLRRRANEAEVGLESDDVHLVVTARASNRPDPVAEPQDLRRLLRELRVQQRRVLLLTYFYGYTNEELARILAVPVGTIKTWIRRSLQRLKRSLDE